MRPATKKFFALLALALLVGCRSSSTDEGGGGASTDFAGNRLDVTGSLSSQTGSQAQMQGWVVALLERDTGTARVSVADEGGNLSFGKTSLSASQTAVLLSPDFLIQSVLVLPSTTPKKVRQYFQLTKNALPRIVQKGAVITFQSTDTISIQDQNAADENADGVPDGVTSFGLNADEIADFLLADTDKDGIDNSIDSDIDGDGVMNAFDSDDDGDGMSDVLDSDADGDGIADSLQQTSDQHYKVGIEYLAVQNITTSESSTLKFVTKVRDGVNVKAVTIRAATSFAQDATATDAAGTTAAWDQTLLDDGLNDDGAANDRLYVRNVNLATGVAPRTNQVVFFQVVIGDGAEQFTVEYPYMFPSLASTVPTTAYDPATRRVTLSGDPFGANLQSFVWTVSVNNSAGIKVYESNVIAGSTRTAVLPANILVSGQTYTYQATAQLMEKVQGYPSMLVQSDPGTISP